MRVTHGPKSSKLDRVTDSLAVDSDAVEGEDLPARLGKPACEICSRINSSLCLPAVRLLGHSRITPRAVTLLSFAVALIAAVMFARGTYPSCVIGALLFFLSGLLDETSSLLAWVTFRESALVTRIKGLIEALTCTVILGGIMIGLYNHCGASDRVCDGILAIACAVPIIVIAIQRHTAANADRLRKHGKSWKALSKKDCSIRFSGIAWQLRTLIRKRVAIHYFLMFTLAGGLPLFLWLAALGGNLSWVLTMYSRSRAYRKPSTRGDAETVQIAA